MRRMSLPLMLVLAVAATCTLAIAQDAAAPDSGGNVHYAWANVTRVNPIYQMVQVATPHQPCNGATSSDAATPCHQVPAVSPERRIVGYTVEYRYRGYVYTSRLDYDPGTRLRVRITVTPAD